MQKLVELFYRIWFQDEGEKEPTYKQKLIIAIVIVISLLVIITMVIIQSISKF